MDFIFGTKVMVSPFLTDIPKLKFDSYFLDGSTKTIDDFNRWLLENFGTIPPFVMPDEILFTTEDGLSMLRVRLADMRGCAKATKRDRDGNERI